MLKQNKFNIAIIDYKMSNLFSVKHACDYVGLNSIITHDKDDIMSAEAVILPGVGAFGDAMENLTKLDLISPIRDFAESGKPLMGICLGLQLLFTESEEFGNFKGLNIINGRVVRFSNNSAEGAKIKIPHVGWSQIFRSDNTSLWGNSPLRLIPEGEYMYFIHSYYIVPENSAIKLTLTSYGGIEFCSSIISKNIFALQFHPEKSAMEGVRIFKDWINYYKGEE